MGHVSFDKVSQVFLDVMSGVLGYWPLGVANDFSPTSVMGEG